MKDRDMEDLSGQMVLTLKDIGLIIKQRVEECSKQLRVISWKVNGKKIELLV